MTLNPGAVLTHYEIMGLLGAGAMGEVYRAKDSRLGREVAIKVLPPHFAADADRLARFEREAQTLASLNHPNVAQIFGVDQVDDTCFLVLELVPGGTLAEALARGPLPVEEALNVCVRIAAGVEAAHEAGVIHRDLKPGNVMLTADGRAKVLDFGLARQESPRGKPASSAQGPLTEEGVLLGTPGYMSPEQVRGRPLDRRTDIFAFGCVLHACLAGRAPFTGETSSDVMAAILEREPDYTALPAKTPPRVRELLAKCLEKDPARRLRDIGDARLELERVIANKEWSTDRLSAIPGGRDREVVPGRLIPWIAGGVIGACAAALVAVDAAPRFWRAGSPAKGPPLIVTRFVVNPPGLPASGEYDTTATLAISPDGTHVAFIARDPASGDATLFLRDMTSIAATAVASAHDPFFSSDGAWLGFMDLNTLCKIPVAGGPRIELSTTPGLNKGSTWGDDGIFCSPSASAGLFRLSPDGGDLTAVTELDAASREVSHRWPELLPDGRHLLCTIKKSGIATFDEAEIAVYSLDHRTWKTLFRGGYYARYAGSGHLVYVRDGALMAMPFDVERLEVTGVATRMIAGVMCEPSSGAAQFALSRNGTLVYAPGGPFENPSELVWIGRDGKETSVGSPVVPCMNMALSPDGRRIAQSIPGATDSVFVYDIERGTRTRVTFEGNASLVTWTPDSENVIYVSDRAGGSLLQSRADGSGTPVRLLADAGLTFRGELTPGPTPALIYAKGLMGERDIWMKSPAEGAEAVPLIQTPFDESEPRLSPDGHWLSYLSDESGTTEVYVRPHPSGAGRWRISRDGACAASWSGDGATIFFMAGDVSAMASEEDRRTVLSVSVSTVGGFSPGQPELAFQWIGTNVMQVAPDGQRILTIRRRNPSFQPTEIYAVLNWFEELKQKAPAR
jgi:eukaryotic-like serine/threonine-protein kinase